MINADIWNGKYASYKGETYEQGCKRVSDALGISQLESILRNELFSVGGRVWYGAGKKKPYMVNCGLFGVEDSAEGWAKLAHDVQLSLMKGMGCGVDYSKIRPYGSYIAGSGGMASGAISTMHIVNEIARHIMQGGTRRCLPEGTKVFTTEGVVNIEDCVAGMFVYTPEGVQPITNVFEQGIQQLVTIETQIGELKCTPNHRVGVLTSIDTYEFKRADELTEDDVMCIGNENNLTELVPVHVKSVTLTEEYSKTYDIEVKDVHCFYANGYLVHNSAMLAQLHWKHGDMDTFIDVKNWDEEYTRLKNINSEQYAAPLDLTNISVRLDPEFIAAYNNGDSVAHQVWDKATRNMFQASEPGFRFNADNQIYTNA